MSAKSRARKYLQLPIAPSDRITGMFPVVDDRVWVQCASGRQFEVVKVARYKRAFKVYEITNAVARHT